MESSGGDCCASSRHPYGQHGVIVPACGDAFLSFYGERQRLTAVGQLISRDHENLAIQEKNS
jgi:hypothetical protein